MVTEYEMERADRAHLVHNVVLMPPLLQPSLHRHQRYLRHAEGIEACQCLKSWLNDFPTPEECMNEDSEQEELELVE